MSAPLVEHVTVQPDEHGVRLARVLVHAPSGLFAVARAMGGFCGGHAADLTLSFLAGEILNKRDSGDALACALMAVNAKVYAAQRQPAPHEPQDFHIGHGAILAGLVVGTANVLSCHVGNCRVFRFRSGKLTGQPDTRLQCLSADHSGRQAWGLPPPLGDFVLSRVVGAEDELPADVSFHPYHRGDVYLLLTDKFAACVPREALLDAAAALPSMTEFGAQLTQHFHRGASRLDGKTGNTPTHALNCGAALCVKLG